MSKFQTIYSIIISCNYVNVNINFVFNQKKTKLNHKKAHLKHQTETFHSHSNRVRKILLPLLAARPMRRLSGILPLHGAAHKNGRPVTRSSVAIIHLENKHRSRIRRQIKRNTVVLKVAGLLLRHDLRGNHVPVSAEPLVVAV